MVMGCDMGMGRDMGCRLRCLFDQVIDAPVFVNQMREQSLISWKDLERNRV